MNWEATSLQGVRLITPLSFSDERGLFLECYHQNKWSSLTTKSFPQSSEVHSHKNVLRGLHFQAPPFGQEKIIRVIQGSILDVVVDIRPSSPTYGKHLSILLSGENKQQLFIPEGFAHGYSVLSDLAIVHYKSSHIYVPHAEQTIDAEDAQLGIDWKIPLEERIRSEKDKTTAIAWTKFISPFPK